MESGKVMDLYQKEVFSIIQKIHDEEKGAILSAARAVADQVKKNRLVYVFGPGGHSNLAAMEVFFRAGMDKDGNLGTSMLVTSDKTLDENPQVAALSLHDFSF